MDDEIRGQVGQALAQIPAGLFLITSHTEDRRSGMLACFVQQVCISPPMICVAIAKGRTVMPLISDARAFAVCQLKQSEKRLARKFDQHFDPSEDPFLGYKLIDDPTGRHLPLPTGCVSYLLCELVSHLDVDGDHDLFVGTVDHAIYHGGRPAVHLREDGFGYR